MLKSIDKIIKKRTLEPWNSEPPNPFLPTDWEKNLKLIWPIFISIIWAGSTGVVIFCSLLPRVEFPVDFWNADKLYHLIAYCWLSILPLVGYSERKFAMKASLSMIFLGIFLETGQLYVPGRTFSVVDISMNTLGVILGAHGGERLRCLFLTHGNFRLFKNIQQ
ncbi:MAG: VanZ family protein [Desulfobacteraceae bacterium]|nr:MAG: VanZ family protein [Desulfobacteraceae bacterium]